MQHGEYGADSWVIQLGIQTLLSCSALTNLEVCTEKNAATQLFLAFVSMSRGSSMGRLSRLRQAGAGDASG